MSEAKPMIYGADPDVALPTAEQASEGWSRLMRELAAMNRQGEAALQAIRQQGPGAVGPLSEGSLFGAPIPCAPVASTPFADLTIEWNDRATGTRYRFKPQPDITAYELAQIMAKNAGMLGGISAAGVTEWLCERDLMKHFEVV